MRRSGLLIGIGALVVVILVLFAAGGRRPKVRKPPESSSESRITALSAPVPFCAASLAEVPHGRVQLLVDSSGSLLGVREPVISYTRWIDQAVSRLRDFAIHIDEFRIASFDEKNGIHPFPSVAVFAKEYKPSPETILHEAIRASAGYDLTFIVTDGVAAAGSGRGDCAGGVDAACAARALREAVHVEPTDSGPFDPGVWIVPLWASHSGIFYTEKPTAAADFDRTASLKSAHDELGQDISIANLRSDSRGNLVYDYTGPRGLLLIVIAHSTDLGRRAIAALHERMADNSIAVVDRLKDAKAIGAWPAIELYPGYVPPVEWLGLRESDEKPAKGTIDVRFTGRRIIELDCPRVKSNETELVLSSRSVRSAVHCVDIHQMPAFELAFVADTPRDQSALDEILVGYERSTTREGDQFTLRLHCGTEHERPCSSDPVHAHWTAQSRYDHSAAPDAGTHSSAHDIVAGISTSDPVRQPHRIYGLDSLLSIFFDEVRQDRKKIPLADLDLCHRSARSQ